MDLGFYGVVHRWTCSEANVRFDFVQVVVNPVVGIVLMLIAMVPWLLWRDADLHSRHALINFQPHFVQYAAMAFWPKFINGVELTSLC